MERLLTGKISEGGPDGLNAGSKVTKPYLDDLDRKKWFEIRLRNEDANKQLEEAGNAAELELDLQFLLLPFLEYAAHIVDI